MAVRAGQTYLQSSIAARLRPRMYCLSAKNGPTTSRRRFSVVFKRDLSGSIERGKPLMVSSSVRTWNLSIRSWHVCREDVFVAERLHAVVRRRSSNNVKKVWFSLLASAMSARPIPMLKSLPSISSYCSTQLLSVSHLLVIQDASTENGSEIALLALDGPKTCVWLRRTSSSDQCLACNAT